MTIFSQTNYRPRSFFGAGSVEVAPPARAGEGGIRRLATNTEALITEPAAGVRTIPDLIDYAARVHGTRPALGWREVLGVHEQTKKDKEGKEKTWKYWDLSEYKWIDYVQFKERVEDVAKGLVELGIGEDDVLDMFAETSPNWQLMSSACAQISTPIATAYDTLGASGLTHSLNEPSCAAIYTNPSLLRTVLAVLPNTPAVRFVFYDGAPSAAEEAILAQIRDITRPDGKPSIKTMHIDALRSLGNSRPAILLLPNRRPTPDRTACIMYTSGSTGAPKGVVLTHANLLASVGAVYTVFQPHLPVGARYAAYLPLAHVLEFVVELCAVFSGVGMGYARVRTLTSQSIWQGEGGEGGEGAAKGTGKGDLEELKPDIMLGVPAVWETVRKAIYAKLESAPRIVQHAFASALQAKKITTSFTSTTSNAGGSSFHSTTTTTTSSGYSAEYSSSTGYNLTPAALNAASAASNAASAALRFVPNLLARGVGAVLDETVLKKVREAVGGNLKWAVNGGAAVSGETQEFFCAAVMPLVQGYGLTETCGMCSFLPPEMLSTGPVGLPAPSVEVKLVDCKEMGYIANPAPGATNEDGTPKLPQGEIWIRGPSVTSGYYKRPDLNRVAREDGSISDDEDEGEDGEEEGGAGKGDGKGDGKEDGKEGGKEKDGKEKKAKPEPVFTRDGWFRTGDVGRWNADGTLSIVDRLKNLVKLQGGEYIALERLESVYKSCSLVGNLCLYANGDMTQPIAIVVPPKPGSGKDRDKSDNSNDGENGENGSKAPGGGNDSASAQEKEKILSALVALGKKNGFSKMELPSAVVLGHEEWTPQNGYVTAAQKVQRAKVAEGFKDEIEACKKAQKGK